MNDLARYMELIVEPTYEEFKGDCGSVRRAYLPCVVAYHAVDRAAYPDDPKDLADEWKKESMAFMLIDEIAQHFKHGQRRWVQKAKAKDPDALLIIHPLGLEGDLEGLEMHAHPNEEGRCRTQKRDRDLFEIVISADQSEQHAEHWQRQ